MMDKDDHNADDEIGAFETTVAAISERKETPLDGELKIKGSEAKRGRILIRCEPVAETNKHYAMQFRWDDAGNVRKGCCGSSVNRVRFEIFRQVGNQWIKTHTTPFAIDSQNPQTPRFSVELGKFNNCDENAQIKFSAVAENVGEVNRVITSQSQLANTDNFVGQEGGNLRFTLNRVEVKPTFLDYLRSGWNVSLCAAIDYTASNGHYTDPRSLHFMGPQNQYEAALFNVGMVIEPYDSDKMFPLYGFGGIPSHMGQA